jgi:preprotein translocase subunit SecB
MSHVTAPPFKFNSFKIEELRLNNRLDLSTERIHHQFDVSGSFEKLNKFFHVHLFFTELIEIDGTEKEKIFVELSGEFEFRDVVSMDDIPDFFWANSIAIMYPYLRSFISLVTMQSSQHTLILPLINLSKLGPKLKENTTAN